MVRRVSSIGGMWNQYNTGKEMPVVSAGQSTRSAIQDLFKAFGEKNGVTPEPHEDHAAYLATWLEVLKNDERAIFTAAAHAKRAVDFLHGLQVPTPTPERATGAQTASALRLSL